MRLSVPIPYLGRNKTALYYTRVVVETFPENSTRKSTAEELKVVGALETQSEKGNAMPTQYGMPRLRTFTAAAVFFPKAACTGAKGAVLFNRAANTKQKYCTNCQTEH